VPGFYPARFPLAQVTNQLWFINHSTEEAYAAAKAIYWKGPIPNEFAKQNMKLIYVQVLPPYQLWSHKAIKSVDEMKGLRIRSWGPYMPRMYSAVGATGVTLVAADWFEAMQKKMTDGGFWSVDVGMGVKVEEVAKYVNMVNLGYNTGPMCVMNLDRWKSLPNDVKEVINQLMIEMPAVGRKLTDEAEQSAINKAKGMGINFIQFEGRQNWIDSLPDLRAQWASDMKDKGLGNEAAEIIKMWDEALKSVRK
jgi:TRAP-type transport system periplasmic protein